MKTTDQTTRNEKIRQTMFLMSKFRRDEEGGLILFSLFIFIMMLLIAGVAVDVMRFETRRTALQNTLDAAALSATNLRQEQDPDTLVRDFMEKAGYEADRVIVDIDTATTGSVDDGSFARLSREVEASYRLDVNTIFMPLIGIESLGTMSAGRAFEQVQNVEISLIVDISGSMRGEKLTALKDSAEIFFETVLGEQDVLPGGRQDGLVSVSVVPYNHTVVMSDELFDEFPNLGVNAVIGDPSDLPEDRVDADFLTDDGDVYTGTMLEYQYNHVFTASSSRPGSRCVRWDDDDMTSSNMASDYLDIRAVDPSSVLDLMASYDPDGKSAGPGGSYDPPDHRSNRRCDPTRSAILAYQTEAEPLIDHVNAMYASGWTAVDHGMKWGLALLDPAFRPLVANMIADDILPNAMEDRPFEYDPGNNIKIVVLMTDGRNTSQFDLKDEFKRGPSRIWRSQMAATDEDPDGAPGNTDWFDEYEVDNINGQRNGTRDRRKQWYDGYFVLFPENDEDERWLRPHKPWDRDDGAMYAEDELPPDAVQLDYAELYDIFSERALAEFFRDDRHVSRAQRNAHRSAERTVVNGNAADDRLIGTGSLEGICDAAKQNGDISVYTIAFGTGADQDVMSACATTGQFYAPNTPEDLRGTFAAIAASITQLRLTQ